MMRLSTYGMECRWSQSHLEADARVLLDVPQGGKFSSWLASILNGLRPFFILKNNCTRGVCKISHGFKALAAYD